MNTSQRGTWGEMRAAVWLMEAGWEVFAGLGNTSCDLIAVRDGVTRRVEVKVATAIKTAIGKPTATRRFAVGASDPGKHDWLLIVWPDGSVGEPDEWVAMPLTRAARLTLANIEAS